MGTIESMSKLNRAQRNAFAKEIDELERETRAKIGAEDVKHIQRMLTLHRLLEIGSRILMVCGFISLWLWVLAVITLGLAKIIENMEIAHNVMHGQYDWMNDSSLHGKTYEWDIVADGDSWRRYHNFEHHTYTNVIGMDRDFGYGLFRLSHDLSWRIKNIWQIIPFTLLTVFFEWGVAYHELAAERVFIGKPKKNSRLPISKVKLKKDFFNKIFKQIFKDYIFFPILCWPLAGQVFLGNLLANVIRNIWAATIIFCGHLTDHVHTFSKESIINESRPDWCYRQVLGSSNMTGSRAFHILTGHLSCQIEHHLFPDIPAWRYPNMSAQLQRICKKYNIPYNTGGFFKQYFTVIKRVLRFSLP